ncbi:hypothetical protein [Flavobacterium sp.]|uniref:hypothetical protein n=1 Tax=Flavobacterium sp. TaxID=239 RepID=UPI00286D2E50|nr:hypothetical protein [Flavobacterium sp.]
MKTVIQFKMILLALTTSLLFSCGGNKMKGSASDTTGTNGATNGTGKIPKSNTVHDYKN